MSFNRLRSYSQFFRYVTATLAVLTTIVVLRQMQVFQTYELEAYDRALQWRSRSFNDPRLLLVNITQADIERLGDPIPDPILVEALERLDSGNPALIGIDLIRDMPDQIFLDYLSSHDTVVIICFLGNSESETVGAPPGLKEKQIGFSDLVFDPDGVVRRNLISASPTTKCQSNYSFSYQLASRYLSLMSPTEIERNPIDWSGKRLDQKNSGGYSKIDPGGFQILLEYRSREPIAQQVTLSQVLQGQVSPMMIQDRIVLIGNTAHTVGDEHQTPFASDQLDNKYMYGIWIHAQMINNLLDIFQEERSAIWFWPEWIETVWIIVWALLGAGIGARIKGFRIMAFLLLVGILSLVGIYLVVYSFSGWIPVAAPIVSLVVTGSVVGLARPKKVPTHRDLKPQSNSGLDPTIPLPPGFSVPPSASRSGQIAILPEDYRLADRYQILSDLSEGGQGHTYTAIDTQRPGQPTCVVKQLLIRSLEPKSLEIRRRLFQREAEILEFLGHHDQIPRLLAYFEEDHGFYLVQEYINGHSLESELSSGSLSQEEAVITLLVEILQVLAYVHDNNVIHRDVKPSNLIRRQDDHRIVLIDFGAVKQVESSEGGTIIGTPGYCPVEQWDGDPKLASDIFAVGMIAIQALSGLSLSELRELVRSSPEESYRCEWGSQVERLEQKLPDCSPKLSQILRKMTATHYLDRYQHASEALQAIEAELGMPLQ